jgi:hypothetical protein
MVLDIPTRLEDGTSYGIREELCEEGTVGSELIAQSVGHDWCGLHCAQTTIMAGAKSGCNGQAMECNESSRRLQREIVIKIPRSAKDSGLDAAPRMSKIQCSRGP